MMVDALTRWASKSNARYYAAIFGLYFLFGCLALAMLLVAWELLTPTSWHLEAILT